MTTVTRTVWKDRFARASEAITEIYNEDKASLIASFIMTTGIAILTGPGFGAAAGGIVTAGFGIIKILGWKSCSLPLLGIALLCTGATVISSAMSSDTSTFNDALNEALSSKEEGAVSTLHETKKTNYVSAWGTKTVTKGQLTRVCQTKDFTLISLGEDEPLLAFPSTVKRPATKAMGTTNITAQMLNACK